MRTKFSLDLLGVLLVCLVAACLSGLLVTAQPGPMPMKLTPLTADGPTPPDDTKLYVWSSPDKGTQSLLVLKVIDADQIEVAYLVPVTVILDYQGKPRATKEQLEQTAVGKLLPFDLRGKDRFGRLTGDAYLGKDQGWLTGIFNKTKAADKK